MPEWVLYIARVAYNHLSLAVFGIAKLTPPFQFSANVQTYA